VVPRLGARGGRNTDHREDTMKKLIGLLALVAAGVAAAGLMAKRRGQDIGEFAGEWADRAKEVADSASSTITDAVKDAGDTVQGAATDLKDDALDLRDSARTTTTS
jgi:hypothetical protein